MTFIMILQISLCLITLGTVIPTVHLGLKIPPVDRPAFFSISGIAIGIIFVIANNFSGSAFSSLWGMYAWVSVVTILAVFLFINYYLRFNLRQALFINLFMQGLLLSAIPMSDFFSYDISISERIILYFSLIISFAFVIYNSSVLLLPHSFVKRIYYSGVYIFIVIMLLIGFDPFTKLSIYRELAHKLSINTGFYWLILSLIIHLVLIPLISFILFSAIKNLCRVPTR